jgi:hypothetical protein
MNEHVSFMQLTQHVVFDAGPLVLQAGLLVLVPPLPLAPPPTLLVPQGAAVVVVDGGGGGGGGAGPPLHFQEKTDNLIL